jgi:hypothetical protein
VQSVRGLAALRDPLTLLDEAYAVVLAENNDPSAEFEKHAEQLINALVRLRKIYQDEGPEVANENSKRYLADAFELVDLLGTRRKIESATSQSGTARSGTTPASDTGKAQTWAVWLGDWLEE